MPHSRKIDQPNIGRLHVKITSICLGVFFYLFPTIFVLIAQQTRLTIQQNVIFAGFFVGQDVNLRYPPLHTSLTNYQLSSFFFVRFERERRRGWEGEVNLSL